MRINYEKWKEHWEEMMIKNGIEYTYIVATETIMANRQYSDAQKIKLLQTMRSVYKEAVKNNR